MLDHHTHVERSLAADVASRTSITDGTAQHVVEEAGIICVAVSALPSSLDALTRWVAALTRDDTPRDDYRVLVDVNDVDVSTRPFVAYLEDLAAALRPLARRVPNGRCAILATPPSLHWWAKLFETVTSDNTVRFRAFRHRDEAVLWLSA